MDRNEPSSRVCLWGRVLTHVIAAGAAAVAAAPTAATAASIAAVTAATTRTAATANAIVAKGHLLHLPCHHRRFHRPQ